MRISQIEKEYIENYSGLIVSIFQQRLITLVTKDLFLDFPENFPLNKLGVLLADIDSIFKSSKTTTSKKPKTKDHTKEEHQPNEITAYLLFIILFKSIKLEFLGKLLNKNLDSPDKIRIKDIFTDEILNDFDDKEITAEGFFKKYISNKEKRKNTLSVDFVYRILNKILNVENIFLYHEFVLLYTQFESFLIASIRTYFQLASENVVELKRLTKNKHKIDAGLDRKISLLIDNYIVDYQYMNFRKQINQIKQIFKIKISNEDFQFLHSSWLIRNQIIHYNGLITKEFSKKNKKKKLVVDAYIKIDMEYLNKLSKILADISNRLFGIILPKYEYLSFAKIFEKDKKQDLSKKPKKVD